jgi:hypothetical protein
MIRNCLCSGRGHNRRMKPSPEGPGCIGSIVRGAICFTIVSLAGFSVWAFAGGWFYANVGEAGLYAACTVVFTGLAGLLMNGLLRGPNRLRRFYVAFVPAFLAYALIWCVCWFLLKGGVGEWVGSLLGSAVFALVLGKMLGSTNGLVPAIVILFGAHSAGYFLGGMAYASVGHPLLWGFFYGIGFGTGIGYAFYRFQKHSGAPVSSAPLSQ